MQKRNIKLLFFIIITQAFLIVSCKSYSKYLLLGDRNKRIISQYEKFNIEVEIKSTYELIPSIEVVTRIEFTLFNNTEGELKFDTALFELLSKNFKYKTNYKFKGSIPPHGSQDYYMEYYTLLSNDNNKELPSDEEIIFKMNEIKVGKKYIPIEDLILKPDMD